VSAQGDTPPTLGTFALQVPKAEGVLTGFSDKLYRSPHRKDSPRAGRVGARGLEVVKQRADSRVLVQEALAQWLAEGDAS
jgi:hypothetical protein